MRTPPSTAESSLSALPPPTRAAFVFVFIAVALDMLALGVMVQVLPKLMVSNLA